MNIHFSDFEQFKNLVSDKNSFQRNSVLLTGHHVAPVATLFFSLTHVTCRHYTTQQSSGTAPVLLTGRYAMSVVIQGYSASATDLRERFLLSGVFYLTFLPAVFKAFLGPAVQPQSQQDFIPIFKTQHWPDYLFESQQYTKQVCWQVLFKCYVMKNLLLTRV